MAHQVIGIGNAIMDVIASVTDDALERLGVRKGIMQLIDRDRSDALTAAGEASGQGLRLVPGGSVANTLAGLGRLGLTTAFIGRVADDDLGRSYAQGMAADVVGALGQRDRGGDELDPRLPGRPQGQQREADAAGGTGALLQRRTPVGGHRERLEPAVDLGDAVLLDALLRAEGLGGPEETGERVVDVGGGDEAQVEGHRSPDESGKPGEGDRILLEDRRGRADRLRDSARRPSRQSRPGPA